MKQLYVVELTREVVVVAESQKEAEQVALDTPDDGSDASAQEMMHYPGDWDEDSIPFGKGDPKDPDRTVSEWIAMGAAPKYKVRPV